MNKIFTKEQVQYALNLALLPRNRMPIFIGRIYGSTHCILSLQNVYPFSLPKVISIQSIHVFQNTIALNSFLPPFSTEVRDFKMSLVHFSGLGGEEHKYSPNFHPFEPYLPHILDCYKDKAGTE